MRSFSSHPAVPSAGGTIAESLIEDGGVGIDVGSAGAATPSGVTILNNRLRNLAGTGIFYSWGEGCSITDNTFQAIGSYGMFLQTSRCRIHHNLVSGAGAASPAFGIQQNGDDNLILDNLVASGGDRGFGIFGTRNHIEGNLANDNASFGFHIGGPSNIYRRNTARGNVGVAGEPPACAAPCSPDLCVTAVNSSTGDNFLPGPPTFPGCI